MLHCSDDGVGLFEAACARYGAAWWLFVEVLSSGMSDFVQVPGGRDPQSSGGDPVAMFRNMLGRFGPALVMVGALVLRLYGIENQSLWADEGTSVALAPRSLVRIAQDAAHDIHPPLYYWTLHAWVQGFGSSVFAVRSLSVVYGVLLVGVTYLLGVRWFGRAAALVAMLAAALAPFAIHYSQETRMYMLVALCGALSWVALDGWLVRSHWRWLVGYWLATLAALYTHYFAIALVVAHNLIWVGVLVRRRGVFDGAGWRFMMGWLGAQVGLGVAYVPLVWYSRATLLSWAAVQSPIAPLAIVEQTLRAFCLGVSVPGGWSLWMLGFVVVLVMGVCGRALCRGGVDGRVFALVWLCVPLVLIMALSLRRPYFQPRFLLLALPAFHLLIGQGAVWLALRLRVWRLGLVLMVVFLVAAARQPLLNEWFDPVYWRDDYRGVAGAVRASAGPDDAVLLVGPGQVEIFDYYYRGDLPRYPLPRAHPLEPAGTLRELELIAQRHRRLYAVLWVPEQSDPAGVITGWLEARAFRAESRWYGGVQLVMYQFGALDAALAPVDVAFGDRLRLVRAAVAPQQAQAGDVVLIATEWAVVRGEGRPLNVFVHLLNDAGEIVAQHDGPPAPLPIAQWSIDGVQVGRFGVSVPQDAPPGRYRLRIGVYDPQDGSRLRLSDGADGLVLADMTIFSGRARR